MLRGQGSTCSENGPDALEHDANGASADVFVQIAAPACLRGEGVSGSLLVASTPLAT